MNTMEIKIIGEIDFKDIKVNIYHDPYTDKNNIICSWQIRNPNTCYVGYMYMNNEIGKISYPEDAIIPEQTDKDIEILPKFIIVGKQELDGELTKSINKYLGSEYLIRNNLHK